MPKTPLPPDEAARLAILRQYDILDTPQEPAFDDLAQLAAFCCQTPFAAINFVKEEEVWSKAVVGLGVRTVAREQSLCAYTVLHNGLWMLPDVTVEPQWANHQPIIEPAVLRFYAGVPLRTPEGHVLGTLCVMDVTPRTLSTEQQNAFHALARQVCHLLEARRAAGARRRRAAERPVAATPAAESVQASDALLHTLFDASPMGVVITRYPDVLYANPTIYAMFGVDVEERERSLSFLEFVAPESLAFQIERSQKRLRGEVVSNIYEVVGKRRDGSYFPILFYTSAVMLQDGPAIIAFISDLTESKRDKEDLENSLAMLRATLDSTADGILVLDLAGQVVNFNQKWVEMWRIPPAFLATRDTEQTQSLILDQVADPVSFLNRARQIISQPDGDSFDELVLKDNRIFERYTQPVQLEGKSVGRVMSYRDMSRRRQLEAQLQQAQKMEAIGRLAGGIAHDFNNILTVIYSACALACHRLDEQSSVRRYISQIEKASERATTLIQQLLAFSRKQVMQPRVLSIHSLLSEMEEMVKRLVGEDILVSLQLAPNLSSIRADPSQMAQVILNLAANARDAMPNGGRLTITADDVTHTPPHPNGEQPLRTSPYVQITIVDNGRGIDPVTLPHIFEPFYTTKASGKGTGLGLSTVYGIVQQTGGEIQVESQLGKGTSVRILLPAVADVPQPVLNPISDAIAMTGTETVLVVEDQEGVRQTTVEILAANGYQVLAAGNAEEACQLHITHRGAVDLLLTDVVMPVTNGRELATRLRTLQPTLKVLYMSGHTEDEEVMHGVRNEQAAFLQKPFTQAELLQKLYTTLRDLA